MYEILRWGQLARHIGMKGKLQVGAELLACPDLAAHYPPLAGWLGADLCTGRREVIPAGPSPAYAPDLLAVGEHSINPVATARKRRPALFELMFEDVYLLVDGGKFCILRRGEVHGETGSMVADLQLARALDAPDFRVEEGAYCGGRNWAGNPAHLLCDHLARACIFRDLLGFDPQSLWLDCAGSPYAEFAVESVVPGMRRMVAGASYHFGRLHLLANSIDVGGHPFWFMEPGLYATVRAALLAALAPRTGSPAERIYLSRFDARRRPLVGERELAATLQQQGFRILTMSELPPAEQLRAVRDARVIVAPHGGALGNLMVVGPQTRVLELFNPHKGIAGFAALARAAGADYRYCLGTADDTAGKGAWCVDPAQVLAQALD